MRFVESFCPHFLFSLSVLTFCSHFLFFRRCRAVETESRMDKVDFLNFARYINPLLFSRSSRLKKKGIYALTGCR
jgi:hypothetical protein